MESGRHTWLAVTPTRWSASNRMGTGNTYEDRDAGRAETIDRTHGECMSQGGKSQSGKSRRERYITRSQAGREKREKRHTS